MKAVNEHWRVALMVVALGLGALWATQSTARTDTQHYKRALAIERQILRNDQDATYGDERYVAVLRELAKVPGRSPDRARAEALSQRISDGRRFAAMDEYPQIDHLPRRLRGTDAPIPTRRKARTISPGAVPASSPGGAPQSAQRLKRAQELGDLTDAQKGKLDIRMYSTSWCGYCKKARRFFQAKGWPVNDRDIEKDSEALAEYREFGNGYGGVPLIVVNGKSFRGFSQPAIQSAVAAVLEGS